MTGNAALKGNGVSTSPVLSGLMFDEGGVLPAATTMAVA